MSRITRYNAAASMGVESMGAHGLVSRPQITFVQEGDATVAEAVHTEPVCMASDVEELEAEIERLRALAMRLLSLRHPEDKAMERLREEVRRYLFGGFTPDEEVQP